MPSIGPKPAAPTYPTPTYTPGKQLPSSPIPNPYDETIPEMPDRFPPPGGSNE